MIRRSFLVLLLAASLSLIVPFPMSVVEPVRSSNFTFIDGTWSTPFSYEVAEGRSVWRPAIVVDSDGTPFGVFSDTWYDVGDGEAFLSYFTSPEEDTWVAANIEGTSGASHHSLAIDADDRIHMGVVLPDSIKYFTTDGHYGPVDGITWSHEVVDTVQSDYCRVFVDEGSSMHIIYTDTAGQSLKHATMSAAGWIVESIEEVPHADAVAFDSDNRIHTCDNTEDGGLVYFSNSTGEWLSETVDSYCNATWSTSVEVLADGTPVVVYCDWLNDNMKVMTRVAGDWVMGAKIAGATHASVAIDKYNNTVISYVADGTVGCLLTQGGAGIQSLIQSGNQLGSPTAIATDSDGYAHMLYVLWQSIDAPSGSYEDHRLVYATNSLDVPRGPNSMTIADEWNGLRLRWDADGGDGCYYDVRGYRIYRGTHPGAEVLLASVGSDTTNYLDKSVDEGTTYYYRVTSYNDEGESLFEAAATADTVGWDWQTGLSVKDYVLIASVAVSVVLIALLVVMRSRRRPGLGDKTEEMG